MQTDLTVRLPFPQSASSGHATQAPVAHLRALDERNPAVPIDALGFQVARAQTLRVEAQNYSHLRALDEGDLAVPVDALGRS